MKYKLTKTEQAEPLFTTLGRLRRQIQDDMGETKRQLALLDKIIDDIKEGKLV